MCPFGFESLFDRVGGTHPETSIQVATVWGSGDADTGNLAPVSRDGVEAAAHTAAPSGGAASTPDPATYRPVAFGPTKSSTGSALAGPAWPVEVTCSECGTQLRLDAVGYRQAVARLVAQGWRYAARPHETAWCPECLPPQGEVSETGALPAASPRVRPRETRSARPDRPQALASPTGTRSLMKESAR